MKHASLWHGHIRSATKLTPSPLRIPTAFEHIFYTKLPYMKTDWVPRAAFVVWDIVDCRQLVPLL